MLHSAAQTNINSDGFRSLREGEAVEFEVEAGPDGRSKAVSVSGPGGATPEVRSSCSSDIAKAINGNVRSDS